MNRFVGLLLLSFVISSNASAGLIQGNYFCEQTFPDGSQLKWIIEVDGGQMRKKAFERDLTFNWREIYSEETSGLWGQKIFAMGGTQSPSIWVLATHDGGGKLILTEIDSGVSKDQKSSISHGVCKRF